MWLWLRVCVCVRALDSKVGSSSCSRPTTLSFFAAIHVLLWCPGMKQSRAGGVTHDRHEQQHTDTYKHGQKSFFPTHAQNTHMQRKRKRKHATYMHKTHTYIFNLIKVKRHSQLYIWHTAGAPQRAQECVNCPHLTIAVSASGYT